MNPISAFFVRNIIVVFFFYGLTFFVMGLALALASHQRSGFHFARVVPPLALFGILHGVHEWVEMIQKYAALTGGYTPALWHEILRLFLLVGSFVALSVFGVALLNPSHKRRWQRYLPLAGMVGLWLLGTLLVTWWFRPLPMDAIAAGDALARYSLGIPGALLGTWALMAQQRTFREHNMPRFGRDLVWCAAALFLYGVVGQIFVRPTLLAPTQILNSTLFLQWFGIPVQLFRTVAAAVLTVYMVHALRAFEVESQRRLEDALRGERRARQQVEHLNQQLANLLDRVVDTQEAERQRIARELHDATGQSLTAIGLGLRGIQNLVEAQAPTVASTLAPQLREIELFSTDALRELRRIIADLRPPQLDDLGLIPALRWYADSFAKRRNIETQIVLDGEPLRLPSEYETVIFRITQEALTNVAKHADASRVTIAVTIRPAWIAVVVADNGRGFDPEAVLRGNRQETTGWGLFGMSERTRLLGGTCTIHSQVGQGTTIQIHIPLQKEEELHVEDPALVG